MTSSTGDLYITGRRGARIGIFIIACGLAVVAIAYVILALQVASHTPNLPFWSVLYETAWAIGWLLAAIGTATVALSLQTTTVSSSTEETGTRKDIDSE